MKPTYLVIPRSHFKVKDTLQINHCVYIVTRVVTPNIWRTILRYFGIPVQTLGAVQIRYSHTTIIDTQLN